MAQYCGGFAVPSPARKSTYTAGDPPMSMPPSSLMSQPADLSDRLRVNSGFFRTSVAGASLTGEQYAGDPGGAVYAASPTPMNANPFSGPGSQGYSQRSMAPSYEASPAMVYSAPPPQQSYGSAMQGHKVHHDEVRETPQQPEYIKNKQMLGQDQQFSSPFDFSQYDEHQADHDQGYSSAVPPAYNSAAPPAYSSAAPPVYSSAPPAYSSTPACSSAPAYGWAPPHAHHTSHSTSAYSSAPPHHAAAPGYSHTMVTSTQRVSCCAGDRRQDPASFGIGAEGGMGPPGPQHCQGHHYSTMCSSASPRGQPLQQMGPPPHQMGPPLHQMGPPPHAMGPSPQPMPPMHMGPPQPVPMGAPPILEGWLSLRIKDSSSHWQARWFCLYDTSIAFSKEERGRNNGFIEFSPMTEVRLFQDSFDTETRGMKRKHPYGFEVSQQGQEVWLFDAGNQKKADIWMNHIRHCVQELQRQGGGFRGAPPGGPCGGPAGPCSSLSPRGPCYAGPPAYGGPGPCGAMGPGYHSAGW